MTRLRLSVITSRSTTISWPCSLVCFQTSRGPETSPSFTRSWRTTSIPSVVSLGSIPKKR